MSGRSGLDPAIKTFVEMKPEGEVEVGSNYEAIILRFEREAFVRLGK